MCIRDRVELSAENANLWIENSHVGKGWKLGSRQIITGVPENHWNIGVLDGICIDIVPMGDKYVVILHDISRMIIVKYYSLHWQVMCLHVFNREHNAVYCCLLYTSLLIVSRQFAS